ncbi:transcription-repair-coupling factor [Companilactobacillus sp. RD055328]|uniref:transcription-repair coupling factor n=1 Tax=Companilactobacillus sp. RD055328 TaxID=2916634 RepID=UPI001FC85895|nr:transcription-repair coupling factor [Companilactobacillus sp. RD055328]GKQ42289.1 transcription-repair-coupling factor [Companilactobacillus sp. RD055328]
MNLIDTFFQNKQIQKFVEKTEYDTKSLLTGLSGSANTLFFAGLLKKKNKLLIVENTNFHANQTFDDLNRIIDDSLTHIFPVEEAISTEMAISSPDSLAQRLDSMNFLSSDKSGILVTSVAGLEYVISDREMFSNHKLQFQTGSEYDLTKLNDTLISMGYHRESIVGKPADFAIRGDILDVYPLNLDNPLRIEFFGDEVDSIRTFDETTQLKIAELAEAEVIPATDRIVELSDTNIIAQNINADLTKLTAKYADNELIEKYETNIKPVIEKLEQNILPDNLGAFIDYLYEDKHSLVDYLDDEDVIIFDDYNRLIDQANDNLSDENAWLTGQMELGKILPNQSIRQRLLDVIKTNHNEQIYLSMLQKGMGRMKLHQVENVHVRSIPKFFSQMPLIKSEVDRWKKDDKTVLFLIANKHRVENIENTLNDFEINAINNTDGDIQAGKVQIINTSLANGFEFNDEKLVVITETELFNKVTKKHRRPTLNNAERLKNYNDLKPGDYVVHVNHGIGKFTGIQTMEVDGKHQDYMTVEYRDNGTIFIPVTQLNLIQKYVASEGKTPRVNKLGGTEWQKTKTKVQSSIEDIADDLIELYAKREAEEGFAFDKDDAMQTDFEDSFAYPETPDQIRSTNEIKHDMEQKRPMDRLLVGDVGFGKTEVALRAAFKAVENQKQVAFLVPTTILAQQHYETMQERFANFPVNVALMSRFQTAKQVKETIKGLKAGTIDIVVGTHRVLSKDIEFSDLGLLIVDEEQRFGVKHKERLKQLKSKIDVLTLTATPIPRTLNMSMLGVRDLSIIETAPSNRYPIQTYVMEQDADAIRSAINRELERNGQVFYLHNRVEDIERTVSQIELLVPDARVAYAHGQMTESQLEGVIYDFLQGEYDVLVTTTIIETGVDMPNANTLIIEDADRYGLSQLYQLRGRVGRSSRVAYAYFMYRPNKVLTEVSENRLEAIKNFTELGSGFKIAMRDLSIRGAGNLLGKQQHGFIDSVGYDMYMQMLTLAVNQKRGIKEKAVTDSELNLKIEAYIPTEYITDDRQKIEMYKRIKQVDSKQSVEEVRSELIDRFGTIPEQTEALIRISYIKTFLDKGQTESLIRKNGQLVLNLSQEVSNKLSGEDIFKALSFTKLKATVNQNDNKFVLTFKSIDDYKDNQILDELESFAKGLNEVVATTEGN